MDETVERFNIFVLVPKLNGKVRLYLDSVRLKQALIWPVHRDPTLSDIFPKLTHVKYLSHIDASSIYHNLRLDEPSSYLTAFTCQFGWYRYKWLSFGAASGGDMFQRKVDEIFKELPNVFGITHDILDVGYDDMAGIMTTCWGESY